MSTEGSGNSPTLGVARQSEEAERFDRLACMAQHLGFDGATICRDSRGCLYLSVRTQRGVLDVVPAHEGGARPPGEVAAKPLRGQEDNHE